MTYLGAGFILLSPDYTVLLVQDASTKKWGFPKGHKESYDVDDISTAKREVQEETGIPPDAYTIHDPAFRITKGTSSYLFRYAVMRKGATTGSIQNQKEISGICWVPVVDLMQSPDMLDGNKYLRTWIANLRSFAPRKDVRAFNTLVCATKSD
jgi:8-oxo-dGTP pyrophosphatase MutT (NUDIX family)